MDQHPDVDAHMSSPSRSFRMRWLAILLLGLPGLLLWLGILRGRDGRLHVFFLDVGQGEAIFVLAPDGQQILVDGGPSPSALLGELGDLMPFWDRSIDVVVLTHPDTDHMAGLAPLGERYKVAELLAIEGLDRAPKGFPLRQALAEAGVSPLQANAGARLVAGAVTLTVLHPSGNPVVEAALDDNDRSVVLRVDYGQTSFLLTGDAQAQAEAEMLAANLPLKADVLKVGHHGSGGGTSEAFLAAVRPSLAVIQVGAGNRYGHPHPTVLERLSGTRVLRTDQVGQIEVISDGKQLWVKTER